MFSVKFLLALALGAVVLLSPSIATAASSEESTAAPRKCVFVADTDGNTIYTVCVPYPLGSTT